MSTDQMTAPAAAVGDQFAQAAQMSRVAQRIAAAKKSDSPRADLALEDMPALFGYLVTLGVMSEEQGRAMAEAFASGDLSALPELPSKGNEFFYDAFLAYRTDAAASVTAANAQGAEADVVSDVVAAVEWIVEHAPAIVAAAEAIAEAASSFWHWLTG